MAHQQWRDKKIKVVKKERSSFVAAPYVPKMVRGWIVINDNCKINQGEISPPKDVCTVTVYIVGETSRKGFFYFLKSVSLLLREQHGISSSMFSQQLKWKPTKQEGFSISTLFHFIP